MLSAPGEVLAETTHTVALVREGQQPFQFRTLRVLTRSLVGKELIDRDLLKLAVRVALTT